MLPWKLDSIVTPLQPFRYQGNLIEKRRCLLLCEEQSGNLIQPLSAQLYTNLWHNNEQTKTPRLVLTTKVIRACFSKLQLLTTFPATTRTLRARQKERSESLQTGRLWKWNWSQCAIKHFISLLFNVNSTSEILEPNFGSMFSQANDLPFASTFVKGHGNTCCYIFNNRKFQVGYPY